MTKSTFYLTKATCFMTVLGGHRGCLIPSITDGAQAGQLLRMHAIINGVIHLASVPTIAPSTGIDDREIVIDFLNPERAFSYIILRSTKTGLELSTLQGGLNRCSS